jgi:hypothetical protein
MEIFEQIKEKLKRYPEVKYEVNDNILVVRPLNEHGFEVAISVDADEYTVSYESWHETFKNAEKALKCFVFGLSDQCRLKVTYRGESPFKWTIEFLNEEQWQEDSTTGLLFTPFWQRKQVKYFSNSIIHQK